MKRKFKLISSIASVSLAVGLLVAGVAAALSRNVGITGSVSFTAVQVDATILVEQGNDATLTAVAASQGDGKFTSGGGSQTGFDYVLGGAESIAALTDENTGGQAVLTYIYQVTVTNNGAKAIFARVNLAAETLPDGFARTYTLLNDGTAAIPTEEGAHTYNDLPLAAKKDLVLTVTYTVTPKLVTVVNPTFTFGAGIALAQTSGGYVTE